MSDALMQKPRGPLKRWARRGANAAVALVALSLPLTFLGMCAYSEPAVGAGLIAIPLATLILWYGGGALWSLFIGALTRRRLRRLLAQTLQDSGVEPGDQSARRREIEREFWRQQQLDALVALRTRFQQEPPDHDLIDALRQRISSNEGTMGGAALLCALITLGAAGTSKATGSSLMLGASVGLVLSLMLASVTLLLLAWESVATQRESREDRREYLRESRRIATMAELSGGLTLAEHEIDEALRGALSGDVAQGGELEQVER